MYISTETVILDLTKDNLWEEVDKKNRWSVKKAEKFGIVIQEDGDRSKCYELYKETCRKNQLMAKSEEEVFCEGKLFTALHNGIIVAFSVIKEKDHMALLTINSSDYNYKYTQANSLLYWKIILSYKEKGFSCFGLGGVDFNAKHRYENSRFKARWGGKIIKNKKKLSFKEFIWWKILRHNVFFRNLKFKIQTISNKK